MQSSNFDKRGTLAVDGFFEIWPGPVKSKQSRRLDQQVFTRNGDWMASWSAAS
jgi:hypothetical protein